MRGQRIETAARIRGELADMRPEGESIKPNDEDVDSGPKTSSCDRQPS